jgi:hypothetical protein
MCNIQTRDALQLISVMGDQEHFSDNHGLVWMANFKRLAVVQVHDERLKWLKSHQGNQIVGIHGRFHSTNNTYGGDASLLYHLQRRL